jgi:ATP adenylyltransferase
MSERPLYAPWRMDYIRSLDKPDAGKCFLCEAAAAQTEQEKADRLVLWTTPQTVVLINRYPYTNGHLLIAPREHIGPGSTSPTSSCSPTTSQRTFIVRRPARSSC